MNTEDKGDIIGKIIAAFFALLAFSLVIAFLSGITGCSAIDKAKSAESKAVTAQKNLTLAQAAKLMRISDYGQEAKYGISLMPISPDQKAVDEILSLQIALAGSGGLTEAKREAFFNAIAKDDLKAHRLLYQAGQKDDANNKKIAADTDALAAANVKVNTLLEAGATLEDHVNHLWDIVYALIALGVVVLVLYVIAKCGETAANVAAKAPL